MVFQPYTTGYLITTAETILITGRRTPPPWLKLLTFFAAIAAVIGGVLVLLLLYNSTGTPQDVSDTILGVIALLMTVLYPATVAIRSYLRLDNPITVPRSSLIAVEAQDAVVRVLATLKGGRKPGWLCFNTRCQEEAENIRLNLAVHAHGRLRCYPVTFLPQGALRAGADKASTRGPVQL